MHRRVLVLAIVSVFVFVGLVATQGNILADPKPMTTYVALGDSLSIGVGATDPAKKGLVQQFKKRATAHMDLTNLSVSGEDSSTFIGSGQLANAVAAIANPSTDTQAVTLGIGGNDLLSLLDPGSPCVVAPSSLACQLFVGAVLSTFASNYTLIIGTLATELASDPGDETFLVMAFYNGFDGTGSPFEPLADATLLGADGVIDCSALGNPVNVGLNDLIACIGAGAGATVVDLHPLFDGIASDLTHIGEGDIHPNDKGHKAIGKALADAAKTD